MSRYLPSVRNETASGSQATTCRHDRSRRPADDGRCDALSVSWAYAGENLYPPWVYSRIDASRYGVSTSGLAWRADALATWSGTLAGMTYRQTLTRAWVSIGVPGADAESAGTYVSYPPQHLPPLPTAVSADDALTWLNQLPPVGAGMSANEHSYVTTPLDSAGVRELMAAAQQPFEQLPEDLRAFIAQPDLQRRLFSATDAYFDAGQRLESVPGGHLLHLISDSQWVCHWLAYLGDDGETGVVCSSAGFGYEPDPDDDPYDHENPADTRWVADSVREFLWRWWADNYVFALAHPHLCPPLQAPSWFDPASYVAGYGSSGP